MTGTEQSSFAKKMRGLAWMRQRYLVIITIIVVLTPTYIAMTLPVPNTESLMAMWNFLQTIKPGDIGLYNSVGFSSGNWQQYWSSQAAIFSETLKHGGKVLFYGETVAMIGDLDRLIANTPIANQLANTPGRGYGVDWIILGVFPTNEPALIGFFANLKTMVKDLKFGKAYSEYPIMANVNSLADCKYFHVFTSDFKIYIRTVTETYHIAYLASYTEDQKVEATQLVRLKQITGALMGLADEAALEILSGIKGPGVGTSNVLNLWGIVMIGGLVIGNIAWLASRKIVKKMEVSR